MQIKMSVSYKTAAQNLEGGLNLLAVKGEYWQWMVVFTAEDISKT